MRRKSRKFGATLLAFCLIVSSLTATTFASVSETQAQIGKYYEVNDSNGELESSPSLEAGSTAQSYADGKVVVDKTISATETENVFDIELSVTTKEKVDIEKLTPPAAVVLVIDVSTSMNEYLGSKSRLKAAQEAAQTFINSFSDSSAVRKISIVSFNKDAAIVQDWTDASELQAAVNNPTRVLRNLTTGSGTNIEGGLLLARNLLLDSSVSAIQNKKVILLSDGGANACVVGSDELASYKNNYTGNDINDSNTYTAEEQLAATSFTGFYGNADYHFHHGGALDAANAVKELATIDTVYCGNSDENLTIHDPLTNDQHRNNYGQTDGCLQTGDNCKYCQQANDYWDGNVNADIKVPEFLNDFSDTFVDADNVEQLLDAFEEIEQQISSLAKAWVVTDPMGSEFISTPTNIVAQADSVLDVADDGTITWDIKNAIPTENEDGSFTYKLTYQIELENLKEGFEEDVFYNTNEITSLTYAVVDTVGGMETVTNGTAYFNIPSVEGYAADLSFDKVGSFDEALSGATFRLTTEDDAAWSMAATSNANGVKFSNIPSGHVYTLEEVSAPEGYSKTDKTYTVAVSYGDISIVGVEDNLTVKNESEKISINGTKVWEDGEAWSKTHRPESITIDLTGKVDGTVVKEKSVNVTPDEDGNWNWSFTDLPKYKGGERINYTIKEVAVDGYKTVIEGSVTEGFTVTNVQIITDVTISKEVTGFLGDRNKEFAFEATVVDSDGKIVDLAEGIYDGYTIKENDVILFELKHDENVTIKDLPLGATLRVIETDARGYDIGVTATDANTTEDSESTLTVFPIVGETEGVNEGGAVLISDGLSVKVTNDREIIPDTGVIIDNMPYIIMLQITLIGAILFILRRRNLEEHE